MKIGVFRCQGGWGLFVKAFENLKVDYQFINNPKDLQEVDAIVMHGGESSAQYLYFKNGGYFEAIKDFAQSGKIIFGTCAGIILLSNINTERVKGLGLLDIEVERNYYGNQIDSGIFKSDVGNEVEFLRAPRISKIGDVTVLDSHNKLPILVRKGNVIGATFHPELGELNKNNILVKLFCKKKR